MVSLLKAFYGDAATKDNEFGYQWLPKRASADAYSHQHMFVDMYKGKIKGFLADGQNPAVGGPNAKLARAAMQQARLAGGEGHLPHRDGRVLEGAGRQRRRTSRPRCSSSPPRRRRRRTASLTNTMRLIQWHEKAVKPPGDVHVRRRVLLQRSPSGCRSCTPAPRRSATRASWPRTSRTATSPNEPDMELGPEGDQRLRHRGDHRQGRQGRLQEGPGRSTPSPT